MQLHLKSSTTRGWIAVAALVSGTLAMPAGAQGSLTLQQAIEQAQTRGLQARAALSSRDAARARDRAFGARLLPQISLNGLVPGYNKSIIPVTQPDGSTLFRSQQETNSSLNMFVTQRLPLTGATLTMNSRLAQVKRSGTTTSETWNSTPFSVTFSQPILRSNSYGWDGAQQRLQGDVAERQYLEAREDVALAASGAFFDYYAAQVGLRNSTTNAAVNDTLYRINQGRFEVGKISENDLLQSELALLRARTSLDGARLEHDRTLAVLRLAINADPRVPLEISVTPTVPSFEVDTAEAVRQALRNRSQVLDLDLQEVQARRRVSEARFSNAQGAQIDLTYGYNASAAERDLAYRNLQPAQKLSLNLTVPVMMWGARSADIQAARADEARVNATSRSTREQVAQEAHFAALQLSQARRMLEIAAKADTVAAKRFEVAYNRYVIGKIGVDNLVLAQSEKDQALNQYVQSLRTFWERYYRLRRLTLYDFEKKEAIQ